jgi:hypothetical protein
MGISVLAQFSIRSCGYGFVVSKPIPKKSELRVVEGALFDIDLWASMISSAN